MPEERVNPASIREFESAAQGVVDAIQQELRLLTSELANYQYQGHNARGFVDSVNSILQDLAWDLNGNLLRIGDALLSTTSHIVVSLAGRPIRLTLEAGGLLLHWQAPYEADQRAGLKNLPELESMVLERFRNIELHLDRLHAALVIVDWQGPARDRLVVEIHRLTKGAQSGIQTHLAELHYNINQQTMTLSHKRGVEKSMWEE